MSETLTLYKLIVLYMLSKVDFPLSNSQISNFLLENDYTDYFTLQQVFSDLMDSELIRMDTTHNSTYYQILKEGENTLLYFGNKVADAIKEEIELYLSLNDVSLKNDCSTVADYYKTINHNYAARCQIREKNNDIIDLTLTVPTKELAKAICENWQQQHQEIYTVLMDLLVK